MPLLCYRITKYDPALRDETGAYTGDDWTSISEIGKMFSGKQLTLTTYLEVEARHLATVASFIEESGTKTVIAQGVEDVDGSFGAYEGQELNAIEAVEVVRRMLREEGWCRLEDGHRFYVHVGYDYYLYVGVDVSCERSVRLAEDLGLFVDRDFRSPSLVREASIAGDQFRLVLQARPVCLDTGAEFGTLDATAELTLGNWFDGHPELTYVAFRGSEDLSLGTDELFEFREQLRQLLERLDGEATLEHLEGQVGFTVSMRRGAGEFSGFVRNQTGTELRVSGMRTDQRSLEQSLGEFDALITEFRITGDPS